MSAAAKFARDHRHGDHPSVARTERSGGKLRLLWSACSIVWTFSAFEPVAFGQIVAVAIPEDPVTIDSGLVSGKVLGSGESLFWHSLRIAARRQSPVA